MKRERIPIAVGQVRADPNPLRAGRAVTVIALDTFYAYIKSNRSQSSRIYRRNIERWPLVTTDPKDTQ